MSNKTACKQCPFRKGSNYVYDADAMAVLEDGNTPACHMKVGFTAIFHHAPMDPSEEHECVGHALWMQDHPDFAVPAVKEGTTT